MQNSARVLGAIPDLLILCFQIVGHGESPAFFNDRYLLLYVAVVLDLLGTMTFTLHGIATTVMINTVELHRT